MLNNDILASLIHYAPDAIIAMNGEGIILFANHQTQFLFGYTPHELEGQTVETLVPIEKNALGHANLKEFIKHPTICHLEEHTILFGLHKSGETFPIEIRLSPFKTEDGLLEIVAMRDASEKNLREQQLIDIHKELERFVFITSHNLQEPLNTLQQLLLMLQENLVSELDEKRRNLIEKISDTGKYLSALIQDLLDFSRIGRHKTFEEIDCNEVLNAIQNQLEALIKETNAKILIPPLLPRLTVIAAEFKMLLQNLLVNAIKFHKKEESPNVIIDVEKQENCWLFSVTDNGIGIEEKFYNEIFIPFRRLHHRRIYPGHGIGLAHCKKIVKLHGGDIWIQSQYRIGTTIFFTIPFNIKESL